MFVQILAFLCITSVVHCIDTCWLCDDAADVSACRNKTITCNAGEECFLEKYVNSQGETRYNAGCRAQTLCRIMATIAQGRRSLDPCGQCCTGPRCQEQLCGSPLSTESTYRCLNCDYVSSAGSCTQRVTCQDTEVCKNGISVDNGLLRYSFGCEEKHKCAAFAAHETSSFNVGRDGLSICSSCCVGDECNKGDCFQLKQSMTPGMFGP